MDRMFRNWQLADLIALVRERYPDWENFGHKDFVADEVRPKRETVARAAELLNRDEVRRLVEGWQHEELLERLERVGRDSNLLFNRVPRQGDMAILYRVRVDAGEFAQQVQRLLYGKGPTPQRIQDFSAYALANKLPNRWPFPTYFLFMTQPQTEFFVKPQVARWFLKYMGQGALYQATPTGQLYGVLRGYAHGLLEALRPLGAEDMVHVQSFLWICARESRGRTGRLDARGQVELDVPPVGEVGYEIGARGVVVRESDDGRQTADGGDGEERRRTADDGRLSDAATVTGDRARNVEEGEGVEPYSLAELAAETGFEEEALARWVQAVERKGQVIFYGPPGTGKTLLAQGVARHLVGGGDGFYELLQLHPAYQYEDFIQGLRPVLGEGGELSYEMKPGRFLTFCREAAAREDTCVLIIDEINRANLSRVFGELMYLLEYRERSIELAGGGELRIPKNVRLLGTMNTADRSIAVVDHALRRRFAFIALQPDYDVLRRYHERQKTGFDVERLVTVLQRLNERIGDANYEVGISFFLRRDLAEHLPDVWRMEIEPYLEELFFDRSEEVEAWRWERVGFL